MSCGDEYGRSYRREPLLHPDGGHPRGPFRFSSGAALFFPKRQSGSASRLFLADVWKTPLSPADQSGGYSLTGRGVRKRLQKKRVPGVITSTAASPSALDGEALGSGAPGSERQDRSMSRKTVLVSDISGQEIADGNAAQLIIKYGDARRGQISDSVSTTPATSVGSTKRSRSAARSLRRSLCASR